MHIGITNERSFAQPVLAPLHDALQSPAAQRNRLPLAARKGCDGHQILGAKCKYSIRDSNLAWSRLLTAPVARAILQLLRMVPANRQNHAETFFLATKHY